MKRRDFLSGAAATIGMTSAANAISPGQLVPVLFGHKAQKTLLEQLPDGVTGLWVMDTAQSSPKLYVPNLVNAGVAVKANLLNQPISMFDLGIAWELNAITVSDNSVVDPYGKQLATTITPTGTGWSLYYNAYLTAGEVGVACEIMSLNSADQDFRMGGTLGNHYQSFTATPSWQTFVFTWDNTDATDQNNIIFCGSPDGSQAAGNFAISKPRLFYGTVDPGPDTLVGHMMVGPDAMNANAASYGSISGGIFTPAANQFSIGSAIWDELLNFDEFTVMTFWEKVSTTVTYNIPFMVASNLNTATIWETTDGALVDGYINGAEVAIGHGTQYAENWDYDGFGFTGRGLRWDGSVGTMFAGHSRMFNAAITGTQSPSNVLGLGGYFITRGSGSAEDLRLAAVVLWAGTVLTDAQYQSAYITISARLKSVSNINMPADRFMIMDGDSIMVGFDSTNGGMAGQAASSFSPQCRANNVASNAATIADMNARVTGEPFVNNVPQGNSDKYILLTNIGHNDIDTTQGGSVASYLSNLGAYYAAAKAADWTNFTQCSILVSALYAGYEQARQQANAALAAGIGTYCDDFINFDLTTGAGAYGTGTIAGTALITSGITGAIAIGMTVVGAGVTDGTIIESGSGSNWVVNNSQTVAVEAMDFIPWVATNTSDGVHPNNSGTAILGSIIAAAINAI